MLPLSGTQNSLVLGVINSSKSPPTVEMEILFLDTQGGGDACLLWAPAQGNPNGVLWLIDGGKSNTAVRLDNIVKLSGCRIGRAIISHFDTDHYLGVSELLETYSGCFEDNLELVCPIPVNQCELVRNYQKFGLGNPGCPSGFQLRKSGMNHAADCTGLTALCVGMKSHPNACFVKPQNCSFGAVKVEHLPSIKILDSASEAEKSNDSSLRWLFKCPSGVTFYTGGDSEHGGLPDVQILKLDHHGGDTEGSNSNLADLTKPKLLIISGPGEGFQHPGLATAQGIANYQNKQDSKHWKTIATASHFDSTSGEVICNAAASGTMGDILISIYSDGNIRTRYGSNDETHSQAGIGIQSEGKLGAIWTNINRQAVGITQNRNQTGNKKRKGDLLASNTSKKAKISCESCGKPVEQDSKFPRLCIACEPPDSEDDEEDLVYVPRPNNRTK